MNDCLPTETPVWQMVETVIRETVAAYGYSEIRFPVVESTDLFKRSIGEVTDIVEKEMYTFDDRNGDSLTLRPEGTACCVRAGNQHGLIYNQEQRLWYMGPMFRHERPQKGRYRQFHQFGLETFGIESADIDAEVIMLSARMWQKLGISEHVRLEINTLGSSEDRATYREALIAFLENHKDKLDDDSQRRMYTNPLRVLDTKNPEIQALLSDAPKLSDYMAEDSKQHFSDLCERLSENGIQYQVNEKLVRGLDYYNRTVFEWITDSLGAQGTICAGGRYDGLVEQLGGKSAPAVGFAMGIERLVLMLQSVVLNEPGNDLIRATVDVYFTAFGRAAEIKAVKLAETLREAIPNLRIVNHCGGGNMKKQLKRADKSGAKVALILGDNELADNVVAVKYLRDSGSAQNDNHKEQQLLSIEQLTAVLSKLV